MHLDRRQRLSQAGAAHAGAGADVELGAMRGAHQQGGVGVQVGMAAPRHRRIAVVGAQVAVGIQALSLAHHQHAVLAGAQRIEAARAAVGQVGEGA
jgi:hypothetical protein